MTNNSAFDKILDSLIDEAIPAVEAVADKNLPDDKEAVISSDIEERIQRLFKNEHKKVRRKKVLRYSRNIAACFLIFTVVLGISVMSVDAFRVRVLNSMMRSDNGSTEIRFEKSDVNSYTSDYIDLEYVPYGFSVVTSKGAGTLFYARFDKGDAYFTVDVCGIDSVSSINTENAFVEKVKINGADGIYSDGDDVNILVFSIGERAVTIIGNIEKDEIMKIAENVR